MRRAGNANANGTEMIASKPADRPFTCILHVPPHLAPNPHHFPHHLERNERNAQVTPSNVKPMK